MITVAQFHLIKHCIEREGLSQRQTAQKLGISRNTVKKHLEAELPPTTMERRRIYGGRKLRRETERIVPLIDEWLKADQNVWKKQRHTAARIYHRLVDEYGFTGSESNIRRLVRQRRTLLPEVYIPLEFQMGQQFQFDWGEADVMLGGRLTRVYLFCMQLSASRKRFVRAYPHEKQEAFLDGFVHGFRYFGGVPAIGLFDNLKTAVIKVLQGRDRLEQEAFQALQAHYVFKAEFCSAEAGNEKGQVEGLVGDSRRNALVPVPHVQSLDELNDLLLAWCERSAQQKKVPYTQETIHEQWLKEKQALHPLPTTDYEACRTAECRVSKISTVTFDRSQYSVPCDYVGQQVWVKGFVDQVIVVAQNQVIAEHRRVYEDGGIHLKLDHYLEALLRKPRAVRDARAMQTADVPQELRGFHRQMNAKYGADGDRGFVRFLLLHREVGMDILIRTVQTAQAAGIFRYEGLRQIVQQLTGQEPNPAALPAASLPADLAEYRVRKADPNRYGELTRGGAAK
ncbi:IS21 family transposase [Paenibacillus sp. JMULE4]|uniref:IS21 family transposase n=1 Tax=Paenibacillus sp. JMULE4 TaxID=2518342 RepID=UPI00157686AB|nr:IS21 family transposase [Paenibacillus sp. JMULE4]NTZ16431.1 IS21 family transposase [Paenibacillus sp. JMULE4]NTZ19907.1 IS21 family transposase [Paenibacillus sp. JMULE4]